MRKSPFLLLLGAFLMWRFVLQFIWRNAVNIAIFNSYDEGWTVKVCSSNTEDSPSSPKCEKLGLGLYSNSQEWSGLVDIHASPNRKGYVQIRFTNGTQKILLPKSAIHGLATHLISYIYVTSKEIGCEIHSPPCS